MQISIEISMYPLAEQQYKSLIWDFIDRLKQIDNLTVVTNGMSSQVFGEYDFTVEQVMAEIKRVHQQVGASVFVCKFIGSDRSTTETRT